MKFKKKIFVVVSGILGILALIVSMNYESFKESFNSSKIAYEQSLTNWKNELKNTKKNVKMLHIYVNYVII